jgi:AMMECR1 domain-containing protein
MLSLSDGKKAVNFAREVIELYVKENDIPRFSLGKSFTEKQGAFVTLHTYPEHDLRGCIGIPLPIIPELIKVDKPEEYLSHIEIGRDGLIVEQGFFKGLLLPQVPIEQGWEKKEFISNTCMKAGLMPDAWFNENTKISKFSGQIFTEIEPRGEIKEKKLDGSHC